MGFFGNKKKGDNLRTLSEKEIQNKLYGRYNRTESSSVVEDHPRETVVSTRKLNPGATVPGMQEDLFKARPSLTDFSPTPKTVSAPMHSDPVRRSSGGATFSSVEVKSPVAPKQKAPKKPGPDYVSIARELFLKVFQAVLRGIKVVLKVMFSIVSNFLNSTDFNDPRVRKAIYGTAGAIFIFVLFLGTHFLNVQREIAMKQPRKASVAQPIVVHSEESPLAPATSSPAIKQAEKEAKQIRKNTPTPVASKTATPPVSEIVATSSAPKAEVVTGKVTKDQPYAIQVATFATRPDAQALVSRIAQGGFPALVKPLTRPGGKTYFCVLIGGFKTGLEAESKLAEFKKTEAAKPFRDAFVRSF